MGYSKEITLSSGTTQYLKIKITDVDVESSDNAFMFGHNCIATVTSILNKYSTYNGLYITSSPYTYSYTTYCTITTETLSVGSSFSFIVPNNLFVYDFTEESDACFLTVMPNSYGFNTYAFSVFKFKISDDYKPKVELSDPTIYDGSYNGLIVSGITSFYFTATLSHNKSGDSSTLSLLSHTGNSYDDLGDDQYKIYQTAKENSLNNYLSYGATATDARGRTASASSNVYTYGYFLPRLVLNTSGENTYVSRCDENGNADGLGLYGFLHLKWETSTIDGTNTLISAVVTSYNSSTKETTTLSSSSGSIDDGYFNYIFPLELEAQANLTIVLTDHIKTNTITSQIVPKGAMPMSLYDEQNVGVGIAYGRMATQVGCWMYMPFYLQSSDSNQMFRIKVDDDGNLTTEKVT